MSFQTRAQVRNDRLAHNTWKLFLPTTIQTAWADTIFFNIILEQHWRIRSSSRNWWDRKTGFCFWNNKNSLLETTTKSLKFCVQETHDVSLYPQAKARGFTPLAWSRVLESNVRAKARGFKPTHVLIKTRHFFERGDIPCGTKFPPRVSHRVDSIMRSAKTVGVKSFIANVILHQGWLFDIVLTPYEEAIIDVRETLTFAERKTIKLTKECFDKTNTPEKFRSSS